MNIGSSQETIRTLHAADCSKMVPFIALFISLCAFLGNSSAITEYNITVGINGNDSIPCLRGNGTCLTLNYVLNTIGTTFTSSTEVDDLKIRIKVEYDNAVEEVFSIYQYNMDIEIFPGEKPVTLCFNRTRQSVSTNTLVHFIAGNPTLRSQYNVSLHFKGLGLQGCRTDDIEDTPPVTFAFNVLEMLQFTQCYVTDKSSLELIIGDIKLVKIGSCDFSHSTFPGGGLVVHYYPYRDRNIEFLIENNNFQNNRGSGDVYSSYFPVTAQALSFNVPVVPHELGNVTVTIRNCTITDNRRWSKYPIVNVNVESSNKIKNGSITISDFNIHDVVGSDYIFYFALKVDLYSYNNEDDSNFEIVMNNCTFSRNNFTFTGLIAGFFQGQENTVKMISIVNSSFINNKGSIAYFDGFAPTGLQFEFDNLVIEGNYGIYILYIGCYRAICQVSFNSLYLQNNLAILVVEESEGTLGLGDHVALITGSNVTVSNTKFIENFGTAIDLTNSHITFSNNVLFSRGYARIGGALKLHDTTIVVEEDSLVHFQNNTADFGGAIYYNSSLENNFLDSCPTSMLFSGNRAIVAGVIFYTARRSHAQELDRFAQTCYNYTNAVGTPVFELRLIENNITVFPGKNMPIGIKVINFLNITTSILARVELQCDSVWHSCLNLGVELQGPRKAILTSREISASDYTIHRTSQSDLSGHMFELVFRGESQSNIEARLNLEIEDCPFGFQFNNTNGICECLKMNSEKFVCSESSGVACVARGYWVGRIDNNNIVAKCEIPFCDPQPSICRIGSDTSSSTTFIVLNQSMDDQCTTNYGGILCKQCQQNASYTFQAYKCIPDNLCQPWQPYTLLSLSLFFQIIFSLVLLGILRLKCTFGSGFLYGPLFYLAVISQLPFSFISEYILLKNIIAIVSSVYFLDLEWFGLIPWCTFDIGSLNNYAFHYIGPIVVIIVIAITILVAYKFPKVLKFLQESPIQAYCLLSVLSFWSLTETSVRIMIGVILPGDNKLRVELEPETVFFTNWHILHAVLALCVMIGLVLPFILLLLLSPFLAIKFNLVKIKPLLDEFQSCYKDRYRWYAAVYLIAWIILLATRYASYNLLFQTELLVLLISHLVMQPYENHWLNVMDILLLTDSLFVYSILVQQDNESGIESLYITILVYVMVIVPLLFIVGATLFIIVQRIGFKKCLSRFNRRNSVGKFQPAFIRRRTSKKPTKPVVTTSVISLDLDDYNTDIELREPFIEIMQKEDY